MKQKAIWINNSFLTWSLFPESSSSVDDEKLHRAYEIWSHAEQILSSKNDELHRADAITALKRCLNQRLQLIEETYNFKALFGKNTHYLEILEYMNLVRPLMLKKLFTIRNDIEHRDAQPPDIERCLELLDLVWYFLKSTDNILSFRKEDVLYEIYSESTQKTQYWASIDFNYESNHKMDIRGWFPNNFISNTKVDGYIKIFIDEIGTKQENWKNSADLDDKLDDDIWLRGYIDADEELTLKILKDSLNTY